MIKRTSIYIWHMIFFIVTSSMHPISPLSTLQFIAKAVIITSENFICKTKSKIKEHRDCDNRFDCLITFQPFVFLKIGQLKLSQSIDLYRDDMFIENFDLLKRMLEASISKKALKYNIQ